MAIVFDCPHCGTNYRLKDELGGKTATCKNPNCRKVIPIPKAKAAPVVAAADLDALAAAAFSDESANQAAVVEWIDVTCSGCDHLWKVEAEREGKNVLCPECRKPNRVPVRKKAEKADWRSGGGGPTGAKKETGLDREGAFSTGQIGGISSQTATKLVRERDSEEEPEVKRKRRLKQLLYGTIFLMVAGTGGYFALKTSREIRADNKMSDAVAEVDDKKDGSNDPRHKSIVHRASGEFRIRSAEKAEDIKAAMLDLQTARNVLNSTQGSAIDRNILLAEVAISMADLLGTPEEIEADTRLDGKTVIPQIRQALQRLGPAEAELVNDSIRAVTRKFAAKQQAVLAEQIAVQLGPDAVGTVGLELLKLDREKHKATVTGMLQKAGNPDAAPSLQALKIFLAITPAKGKEAPKGKEIPPSTKAIAEAAALKNDPAGARAAASRGTTDEKAAAFAAAGIVLDDVPMLTEAANLLKGSKTTANVWVCLRVCRALANLGAVDKAEELAASLNDDAAKAWGRLEVIRGRLLAGKSAKADDSWLDPLGDPVKSGAALKAREEFARHNARNGHEYQSVIKGWTKGSVRPAGIAGTLLGIQDR